MLRNIPLKLLLAACIAAVLGPACGGRRAGDTVVEPERVRVGYIPVTHCLPLYVGLETSQFKQAGLRVDLVPLAGGAKILEALAARDVDVGFSNVVSPMLARSQGLAFVVFGGGPVEDESHRDHAIMVRTDDRSRTIEDLKGRSIAVNTRRAIDHLMLLLLLEKHGLSEPDVTLVEVPFPRMLSALATKAVDAVANAEPFITLGLDTGAVRVLDWNYISVRPVTFVSTYVTTEAFARDKRETLVRFQKALGRATQQVEADPAAARRILAKYLKIDEAVARRVNLPRFEAELDRGNVLETLNSARRLGLLSRDVSLDALLLRAN